MPICVKHYALFFRFAVAPDSVNRLGLNPRLWMARAINSFPVPVSPEIKTVESVGATFTMPSSTACSASDEPTISSNIKARSIFSRDGKDDIPMLVEYFVKRFAVKMGKQINNIDKKTIEFCQKYHWPGNIRELGVFPASIGKHGVTIQVFELKS